MMAMAMAMAMAIISLISIISITSMSVHYYFIIQVRGYGPAKVQLGGGNSWEF
jgi:hypothetical protein